MPHQATEPDTAELITALEDGEDVVRFRRDEPDGTDAEDRGGPVVPDDATLDGAVTSSARAEPSLTASVTADAGISPGVAFLGPGVEPVPEARRNCKVFFCEGVRRCSSQSCASADPTTRS